ncbi:MAG: sensor histidine kinase [Clostridiales bacterium]|jgi:two-component system sensor histidine kinase YesM|nr:sensor histidine kinase [Clostridiales bacterium]
MSGFKSFLDDVFTFAFKRRYYPVIALRLVVLAGFIFMAVYAAYSYRPFIVFAIILSVGGLYGLFETLHIFYDDLQNPINYIKQMNIPMPEASNYSSYSEYLLACLAHAEEVAAREYNLELMQRQAVLTAMQNQINPHFLYNTLDSIRGQLLEEGSIESAEMLETLSSFFRYTITQKSSVVPFERELFHVLNYIKIQKYRFKDRFEIITEGKCEDTQIVTYPIPKLTLQPLVENAIAHGLKDTITGGVIKITVEKAEGYFIISVSDNGCGIDEEKLLKIKAELAGDFFAEGRDISNKGIALSNVNIRIQNMYGNEYGLDITSTRGIGTTVSIRLPLNREEESHE